MRLRKVKKTKNMISFRYRGKSVQYSYISYRDLENIISSIVLVSSSFGHLNSRSLRKQAEVSQ